MKNTPSQSDLQIIIAGGGPAGLLCALQCKRNGFSPIVLESRPSIQSAGDFVVIGDSAIRGLKLWPSLSKAFEEQTWHTQQTFHTHTGEQAIGPVSLAFGVCIERSRLHSLLWEAVEAEHIDLRVNQRVVGYTEDAKQGGVVLSDGTTLYADLIIAADGIHSKSGKLVAGTEPRVYSSGEAIARASFPVGEALKSELVRSKWLPEGDTDKMAMFLGPDSHAIMWISKDTASWHWMHKDDGVTSSESWTATLSPEYALSRFDPEGTWSADYRAMVSATPPNNIVDWRLMWRDLTDRWVSPLGRVVQIGDAAHAFLPTSANGATQALEDALSLPVCLRLALESGMADPLLHGSLVHNTLRLDRVSCLQLYGLQRRNAYRHVDWAAAREDPRKIVYGPPEWQRRHDPAVYAEEMFEPCLRSLRSGERFENSNVQPGYKHHHWKITDIVEDADHEQATFGRAE